MTAAAPVLAVNATMRRARRARRGVKTRIIAPLVVIGLIIVGAIAVPIAYGFDPLQADLLARLAPPGAVTSDGSTALLGTDQIGSDLFAQIMAGARVSLLVGVATLAISGLVGVALGLLAGHFGGWIDATLMRIADIQLAFPSILLAILIASVLGQGVGNIIIVLSISNWVVFARVARSQVLSLKNREYVEAARTLGAGNWHLMFRTLLPGCMAPVIVVATTQFAQVILTEASLSFLGVGVPLGTPSLGSTIFNGTQYLSTAWWISTFPGVVLVILMLAFGILGDALRDKFDPTLRSA
ncbi:ABC transporter permease [Cellulomonas chengniuliangii]|uniref:ABC transporter permease n=1 Tax=Cellulomonas chengniuliangii TaxID=2968084 RepID=A0ABY5L4E6_9CELL|nr:ABC transporter permease [Cellulomonas chengniuliangii]MCC2308290.1 ABC transporter permease [Cellulomonas chengniuliangii]MCC2317298.1 ABC transporter permease [Cellulomonas chengniuliangii]UUI76674.1 ABC transporter permease [Cellulomonas chengniuliangii]